MNVLFVCVGNINRSQIAEAIYNKLSKKNVAFSAGIRPRRAGVLLKNEHNNPVLPMKMFGLDLSRAKVKKMNSAVVDSADKVVCVLPKKYRKEIPRYLQNRPDLEFWEVDAIRSETQFEEYLELEALRIKQIESYVKDLVRRTG